MSRQGAPSTGLHSVHTSSIDDHHLYSLSQPDQNQSFIPRSPQTPRGSTTMALNGVNTPGHLKTPTKPSQPPEAAVDLTAVQESPMSLSSMDSTSQKSLGRPRRSSVKMEAIWDKFQYVFLNIYSRFMVSWFMLQNVRGLIFDPHVHLG